MSDYQHIRYAVQDGILTITLHRPDQLNALTALMVQELLDAFDRSDADDAIKCVIVTGEGRAFCAGADLGRGAGTWSEHETKMKEHEAGSPYKGDGGGRVTRRIFDSHKPVIAAINGPAAGLGFVIALYADLRFAASDAKFTTSFAQRGLIAEHGVSWLLPRLVGPANAMDLLLSARKFSAAEAKALGLVNDVFPQEELMGRVLAYARALADSVSPRSMAVIKAQLWKAPFQDFGDALATANTEMQKSFASEDFKEGVAHYMEKRAPKFKGR